MALPKPARGASASQAGAQDGSTLPMDDAHVRTVGTTLREARDRRGWTLAEVAEYLRIRPAILEAMEAGHFEKIPAGAYALGFVRTYADFLGLDRDEIIRRVKAEAAAVAARTKLTFPQPITESRLPSGIVLALSAILAVGAYGLWYYQSSNTATLARVEAVPERMAALVDRSPAPSNSPSKAEAATPAGSVPIFSSETPPPDAAAAASLATPESQLAALPPAAAPETSPSREAEASLPKQFGESGGARIIVKATADSWVQVRDPAGSVVFSRILRSGDSYAAPNRSGYKLATGSAGVLDISVDGQKVPAIGRIGFTRRDVLLDPARLLAGTAAPEAPPAAPARPASASPSVGPANEAAPDRPSGG
jgi:cytoskeleton protein RodZ